MFSTIEAANCIGVSKNTLLRWLDEGLVNFSTIRTLQTAYEDPPLVRRYLSGFVPIRFAEIPSQKELQQLAAQNNASYRASVQALQGAEISLSIADAARWPRMDLTASYGYTQTAKDLSVRLDDPDETWNVPFKFPVPPPDFTIHKSRTLTLKSNKKARRLSEKSKLP